MLCMDKPPGTCYTGHTTDVMRRGGPAAVFRSFGKLKQILFVCTGNTCRSPMAEGIFNAEAKRRGLDARAFSRGLMADGGPATEYAVEAAREYGADLTGHRSSQLTREDLDRADRVLCLTDSHRAAILAAAPELAEKVALLSPEGVSDPYGGTLALYRKTAAQIAAALEKWYDAL